jgi:hypothetical protein
MASSGGLYVTANTTAFYAPGAASQYTTGWAAFGSQKGDLTVTEDATNSKLTLKPGRYLVKFHASVETEVVSGTSGDSVGIVAFQLYKDLVATPTAITGAKASVDAQAADRPTNVSLEAIVTIASTDSGDVMIYVDPTDASGNDIVISEAQLIAIQVD